MRMLNLSYVIPGVSASTINPVNPLPFDAGSVTAKTKYHYEREKKKNRILRISFQGSAKANREKKIALAYFPFVIQHFAPLIT